MRLDGVKVSSVRLFCDGYYNRPVRVPQIACLEAFEV